MRHILGVSSLALAGLIFGATAALSEPLDGRYVGQDDAVNTFIEIEQDGDAITGTMYGADKGQFEGETTGRNAGEGKIDLTGVGEFDYTLRLRGDILTFSLLANDQKVDFRFERDDDAPAPGDEIAPPVAEDTPAPPPLEPAPGTRYFYAIDGKQVGPVSLEELSSAIADNIVDGEALVWLEGTPAWVPASEVPELAAILPPPLPSETEYYVAIDGVEQGPLTLDEVADLIAAGTADQTTLGWHKGLESWAPLGEIEEFDEAFVTPPPLPDTTDEETGPPPLPGSDGASIPPLPDDPAGTPVDDELATLMRGNITEDFPEATPEQVEYILSCSLIALSQIDAASRQELIETKLDPDFDAFEKDNPGVLDTLMACPTGAQLSEAPAGADDAAAASDLPEMAPAPPDLPTAAPAEIDLLQSPVEAMVAESMSDADAEAQAAVVTCILKALERVTPEDRQMLIDTDMDPPEAGREPFEAANPGVLAEAEACTK